MRVLVNTVTILRVPAERLSGFQEGLLSRVSSLTADLMSPSNSAFQLLAMTRNTYIEHTVRRVDGFICQRVQMSYKIVG
jgi:hypothetical protein